MNKMSLIILTLLIGFSQINKVFSHHILGRPSYQLNEDSNTPPSLQGEAEMGEFYVTYMIYPAFPKPEEPGRISIYIKRYKNSRSFDGAVKFTARYENLFSFSNFDSLGTQRLDDSVYRQSFNFHQSGDYTIRAKFRANEEDYTLDIPLRVGAPKFIGPIGIVVGVIFALLILVSTVQYSRSMNGKTRTQHQIGRQS